MTTTAPERPLRADARRNHERIVAAAREVFAEHGTATTMEEVARAAGVGIGTLYRRFPARIDLVEAVYTEDLDALVAAVDTVTDDAWHDLVTWIDAFLVYAAAKRTFLSELHEAFEHKTDLAATSRARMRAAWETVLQRAQDAGVVRTDVTGADLQQLIGGMCMASQTPIQQNRRLVALVLDGLRVFSH